MSSLDLAAWLDDDHYIGEGIHPTARGPARIAEALIETLRPML